MPYTHPTDEIRGTYYDIYGGKLIVFGLTSSVAIYRAIDVMRELIRRNARVVPILSREASKLISPTLLKWATGEEVYIEFGGESGHITLSHNALSMVICPATANTIAKIAAGIADTSVTLTALSVLGLSKPLIIVPAMHYSLWNSPQVRNALRVLNDLGVTIVPPKIIEGKAKIASIDDVIEAVEAASLRGRDLEGIRVLVTAGPTREFLDDLRYLTNPSSGKMGVAIAREAYFRGADVTLIHGPITIEVPHYINTIKVRTTEEMLNAIMNEIRKRQYDVIIMAAAPSDFKFSRKFNGKLSSEKAVEVMLEPTPKISKHIRKHFNGLLIGFSAEYAKGNKDLLKELATRKLHERMFDVIVANDVSREDVGFSSDYNEVIIITTKDKIIDVPKAPKTVIARAILDQVKVMLHST